MENWCNDIDGKLPKYSERNLFQCQFAPPTSTDLELNLDLRCERPATNRMSHVTATGLSEIEFWRYERINCV